MSEWPDKWFRDSSRRGGPAQSGAGEAGADGAVTPGGAADAGMAGGVGVPGGPAGGTGVAGDGAEPTVRLAAGPAPQPAADRAGPIPGTMAGAAPAGGWPAQPPLRSEPGAPGVSGPGVPGGPGRPRRWLRPRRIFTIVAALIAVALIATVGMYFYLNGKLTHKNVLVNYAGRPAAGAGTNWLITGSDSRQGLTRKEERQLATGHDISGHRSDTIMILHIPSGGGPAVLVSIPRDSYVNIPGYGMNKINAAYAFGGPKLLARTVQNATGLYINHYMGIGFGGFVSVVNAVGGVRMCLPGPMVDPKAGLHLKAGCQTLNGAQALGFVRTRNFAVSDLQREQDQRLFLRALLSKMTSMGTMLNPFAAIPAASGVASTVTVDNGTSLYQLLQVAFALRHPETTTVPIASASYVTPAGDAVLWNQAQASRLFRLLREDKKIPRSLLTGSKIAPTG
jgi:LCP family protein required for cell wall assembly